MKLSVALVSHPRLLVSAKERSSIMRRFLISAYRMTDPHCSRSRNQLLNWLRLHIGVSATLIPARRVLLDHRTRWGLLPFLHRFDSLLANRGSVSSGFFRSACDALRIFRLSVMQHSRPASPYSWPHCDLSRFRSCPSQLYERPNSVMNTCALQIYFPFNNQGLRYSFFGYDDHISLINQ